jgi:hypothetical protein
MYRLTTTTMIERIADGAQIPAVPGNREYDEFLAWCAKGNTPGSAAPEPVRKKTLTVERLAAALVKKGALLADDIDAAKTDRLAP